MFLMDAKTARNEKNAPQGVEDAFLRQIANQEAGALQQLYAVAAPKVFGYALSILRNRQEAEDILQDTFLKISEKAGTYASKGKPIN